MKWSLFKGALTAHNSHVLSKNELVHSLQSVDWQPVDEPPANDQVVGREVQQVRKNVAEVVHL